jgi:F-type H+-transporting ATPase subunit b
VLIDPFTIIAQIINFAILAVALKYLLYDRVIEAMDRREASIAARLTEAEQSVSEAHAEAVEYRQQREALDHERRQLLDEARTEADQHRQRLLDQARFDVEDERRRWQRGLRAEQHDLETELRRRSAEEVVELSRRALADLARVDIETDVLHQALDHLTSSSEARSALLPGRDASTPLTVRTAFALDGRQRDRVDRRLRELGVVAADSDVRYEQDVELLVGVEFRTDGTSVSWNATDYLDRLGVSLDELLTEVAPPSDDH